MITKLRIYLLKRRARQHLNAYLNMRGQFDCGKNLAEYISYTAAVEKRNYERTMDKLRAIDPTCPQENVI